MNPYELILATLAFVAVAVLAPWGKHRMAKFRAFDPVCLDTADHFLSEDPPLPTAIREQRRNALASAIQEAVEDWHATHPAIALAPKEEDR